MIKTILVPVGGASVEASTFEAAVTLVRLFSGHIDFLSELAAGDPHSSATEPDLREPTGHGVGSANDRWGSRHARHQSDR